MAADYKPNLALWRVRAAEARTQAEQMTNPDARRMMLRVAETYERMIAFEEAKKGAPLTAAPGVWADRRRQKRPPVLGPGRGPYPVCW
jgi:hypothetical protein